MGGVRNPVPTTVSSAHYCFQCIQLFPVPTTGAEPSPGADARLHIKRGEKHGDIEVGRTDVVDFFAACRKKRQGCLGWERSIFCLQKRGEKAALYGRLPYMGEGSLFCLCQSLRRR